MLIFDFVEPIQFQFKFDQFHFQNRKKNSALGL